MPEARLSWDERHRRGEGPTEPSALLIQAVAGLSPGRALDLACGRGRHAPYLASIGWKVTAVDSSRAAIGLLRAEAPGIETHHADLERGEFLIAPNAWDLVCDFHYLQRNLFPSIRSGVAAGGIFAGAFRMKGRFAVEPGELRQLFVEWNLLHYSESRDAEIVARKG